uniref:Receptor-like serine/threonine-protein kinase n=1 Tax=Davidia involucrata TaxID=16924 RepID=A0A5B7AC59_DAVIN
MACVLSHPLCFFLLLLLPFSTTAQTYKNITLGSSLTARNDNSSWESPSGEFAFGFQQIGTGGFLLAIWFNKIPEKTIIWSANGNNLVQSGSTIQLTTDGRLVLNDTKGQQVWNADSAGTGVSYAAMLDTGNFVLAGRDSALLWESFNEPTDTILPTQTLNQGNKLVARLSEMDYSNGRFQFSLQSDGNLVLYTTDFPMDSVNEAYWSSNTVGSGYQVIFNQSGFIYLIAMNGSILTTILSDGASDRDFYKRAILEYDGVFREYVYPKTAGSSRPMAWSTLSSSVPEDICMSIRQDTGGGACGFNSYCRLGDNQRPNCECPYGYTLLDPSNKVSGCKQNFVPQSCDGLKETEMFEFRDMPNTDWPLSDYMHFKKVTEDYCREACLDDCFCDVAIFRDGDCWKKRMPLSNGKIDPKVGGKALIKIRKDNSTGGGNQPPEKKDQPPIPKKKDQSGLILTGSVLLGSSVFLNLLLLVVTLLFILRLNRKKPKTLQPCSTMPGMNLRSFSYKELEEATDGFREELGRGSFGIVYKGIISYENGNFVAVKKLDKLEKRVEQEFNTEVSAIGRTNHKNLVQLLGFCNEGDNRLLVYEFMSNGSLAGILFGDSRLSWDKRIQIAFGTARGVYYLHEECSTQMIHCDIKPQNILLDDSFTARISDFGLAKLLKTDQTQTTTTVRGTKGYVAPEWFRNKPVTLKVDVYSFGIVFLELIFCRKNFEPEVEDETQMVLADWAYDCYKEGKLNLLVENDEEAMCDMKRLEKFVAIAMWCIQEDPSLRPSMKKVTQMLEGAVDVAIPPDPSSYISSI